MEYYNLQNKEKFEAYYQNKINSLLLNPEITEYLDKNQIDLNVKKDLNLFPNYDKKKFKNVRATLSRLNTDDSLPPLPKKRQKFSKKENSEFISKKITEVDSKLHKIEQKVSDEIVNQMSNFEARKRQKKIRKKDGTISTQSEMEQDMIIKEPKESEGIFSFDIDKEIEKGKENEILTNELVDFPPRNFRRRGSSIGQNAMLKEIEEYVEKNKKEMYQALEELKVSYEPEIKEAEESGFPDIAESLRDDMNGELENLSAQFEEQRMKEVEAIRAKYVKKEMY